MKASSLTKMKMKTIEDGVGTREKSDAEKRGRRTKLVWMRKTLI